MSRVYDVAPKYTYFCTKEVEGVTKIWGAYCTYYRYQWDDTKRYCVIDKVVLFHGTVGKKLRVAYSYCPRQVDQYYNRKVKKGYQRHLNIEEVHQKYPFVHDSVSKVVMWDALRN